jgi:hypothetical protein
MLFHQLMLMLMLLHHIFMFDVVEMHLMIHALVFHVV